MIYLWIRKTVEWADEGAFRAQLDAGFAPKVELWNETFELPFHEFRRRVREIAQLNLSRVEGAIQAGWDDIPAGSLVIPLDDDDWLAPDIASVLEAAVEQSAVCYRWTTTRIEVPLGPRHRIALARRRLRPSTPPRWICSSNNYALMKAARHTKELAYSHMRASNWVESAAAGAVKTIDRRLSLINRTLGSRTTLGGRSRRLTRSQLLRKYRRYRRLYRRRPPDAELEWCRPYVEQMAELMSALRRAR